MKCFEMRVVAEWYVYDGLRILAFESVLCSLSYKTPLVKIDILLVPIKEHMK